MAQRRPSRLTPGRVAAAQSVSPGNSNPINVLDEAFGAVRILGQAVTAYRQLVNRPFMNPQDSRMVPNTFEAYTLTESAGAISYNGGYITKMKVRQSESCVWMSNIAGGSGNQKGVIYAGGTWDFAENGSVRMDEQYAVDVFNTFYVDGKCPFAIDDKTSLTPGAQYFPQRGAALCADDRDHINVQTGSPIPDRNETDVHADYAIGYRRLTHTTEPPMPGFVCLKCLSVFSYLQFQGSQLVIAAASTVQIALIVLMVAGIERIVGMGRIIRSR